MSDLPEKKKPGRPKGSKTTPRDRPKAPSRKDMAENARFWLSLQSVKKNPLTRQNELLSNLDLINIKMINKAKAGNVNAFNAIMDRAFGKPKQYTEVDINQRISIAAFQWADGEVPKVLTKATLESIEEANYEEPELADPEVEEFQKETDEAD